MLKKLRHKKIAKKIWIILAVVIVPAFVLWGSGSIMRNKEESGIIGKIFGKNISYQEYRDAIDAVRNQAIMQFGDNFSEIQKHFNLEAQAWERLLLLTEVKKRKITVSDKEVVELIASYPFFKDSKGRFNERIYSQTLTYVFHTQPRVFEEQLRQNLALNKLFKQITDLATLTDEQVKQEYIKANEEVSLNYIAGVPADFSQDITPSEEELKNYFNANSFEFKQPLSFNLEYVSADSESRIKSFAKSLNKKADFAKLAKDAGLELKETGLFAQTDSIPGIGWAPPMLTLISKLKAGEYSPAVVQIDKTYYLFRLKERKEPYVPEFSAIKEKVKEALVKEKTKGFAREKIENALKDLKTEYELNPKAVDFGKVARKYGLKSDSTGSFKFGSYVEGIGASDIFWTTARGLKDNEFSQLIEVPSGFYIISLKSKNLIDEKKFGEEKEDFSQKLLLQKKQELFVKFLDELKRKAQLF